VKLLKSVKVNEMVDACWERDIDIHDVEADVSMPNDGNGWYTPYESTIQLVKLIEKGRKAGQPVIDVHAKCYDAHLFFLGSVKAVKAKVQAIIDADIADYGEQEAQDAEVEKYTSKRVKKGKSK
jgi:hypothetical protein